MLLPGATALRDTADALVNAEQSGDDLAVNLARTARGIALLHQEGAEREPGRDLLAKARENALNERFSLTILPVTDIYTARESIRRGDIDDAITLASEAHNATINQGGSLWTALAAGTLVEALLQRGSRGDLEDAEAAIDRWRPCRPILAMCCTRSPCFDCAPCWRVRETTRSCIETSAIATERWPPILVSKARWRGRRRCRDCVPHVQHRTTGEAKFCDECGAPVSAATRSAEYKQVTVLFADVVHSMDIAAEVGPERLREIMAELLDRSTAVVKHYGGTVDKFTGDGIMAVFGAPTMLEDHAFRACLAALAIQNEMDALSAVVRDRDRIALQLRIGLNSGQVIAGEIGSSTASYTAIGDQVGMAQRMESAAPPGGVMLSDSTARLVENVVLLGDPELVQIKGTDAPVPATRLLAVGEHQARRRSDSTLVGRKWELNTVTALLEEAIGGTGCVVTVVGPPGIGKSRLVRETVASAAGRGVPVLTTHCGSHTTDIPFHVVAQLMRANIGIEGLGADKSRAHIRARLPHADPEDLLLIDDLLGIGDPEVALPDIGPDARRRRLTALVNGAALAGREPMVVVIEDALDRRGE